MDRVGFDRIKHKVLKFKLKGDKNMILKEDKFLQFNEQIKQQGGCKKVSFEEGEQIAAELLQELKTSKSGVGLAALPDYLTVKQPNIVKVLPSIEGPITEAHFVYPQSLKNVARVQAFRNFLYSKISEWEF